ncbi:MAG: ABC transporter permease, partial [Candidatus Eisenbacteria bacterium]|nr:ABC transporter permease [Candidatus Eisenbacteria bacterium]
MKLSWPRVLTVARREFLTTVRRKAFLFMLIGTPAYLAFVMSISAGTEGKERVAALKQLETLGVVDSSGTLANGAPEIRTESLPADNPFARKNGMQSLAKIAPQTFTTRVRFFGDEASAQQALRDQSISQLLVVPADYLRDGTLRRYARSSNLFSSADRRAVSGWLSQSLVRGRVDSMIAARVARPSEKESFYTLNGRSGQFEIKDDKREMLDFMLPFLFSMVLGLCIIIGGQYLLQGVAEEKESRILESLLCTVSADELMAGKLLGLGSVGLAVVGIWAVAGLAIASPLLVLVRATLSPDLLAIALAYFLIGYLFFGSIMTGIGAMTNNMREAQQFAVWFTFANFAPFIMITRILGHPSSPLAIGLSMFPPTASTAMMLRLTAPNASVPAWQIGLSLALLAAAAWLALR